MSQYRVITFLSGENTGAVKKVETFDTKTSSSPGQQFSPLADQIAAMNLGDRSQRGMPHEMV